MGYVCAGCALLLAILFYMTTRKLYNAGTLFSGCWALVLFLSALNPDHAQPIGSETYALILLGLFSFALGAFLCQLLPHLSMPRRGFDFTIPSYLGLEIACLAVCAYSVYRAGIVAAYLARGYSWGHIRMMHGLAGATGENTLRGGAWSQLLHDWIVAPCAYLIAPVALIDLFLGRRHRPFLFLALAAILLYSLATVSRSVWGFSLLYLSVILAVFGKRRALPARVKRALKRLPAAGAVLLLLVLLITRARSDGGRVNLAYNALAYLTGGVNLFDLRLREPVAALRTHGFMTLYGFVFPLFFLLNFTGLLKYPAALSNVTAIKQALEEYAQISPHVRMNAYSSIFFNFYNDFGPLGVALGSFLFGYLCMLSYACFMRRKNARAFACYLLLIQFMLFSGARAYTIYTTRALSLAWLPLLLPRRRWAVGLERGNAALGRRLSWRSRQG